MSTDFLAYQNPSKPYILDTDCSGVGIGRVLSQLDKNGQERPVAYYSHTLNNAEMRYIIKKQEMCALVAGIRHFRPYLYGRQFTARVEHHSLIWLTNLKAPTGILASWMETLGLFDFTVIHCPGRLHANADGPSRKYEEIIDSHLRTAIGGGNDRPTAVEALTSWMVSMGSADRNMCEPTIILLRAAITGTDSQPTNGPPLTTPTDSLIQAQQEDGDFRPLLGYLNSGQLPGVIAIRKLSLATRFYLRK